MQALFLASLGLEITADVMADLIDKCEAALTHILHVNPHDVAFTIDAQNPGVMTDEEFAEVKRAAADELYKRRVAHFDKAYG